MEDSEPMQVKLSNCDLSVPHILKQDYATGASITLKLLLVLY